jgi:hypothetical protein
MTGLNRKLGHPILFFESLAGKGFQQIAVNPCQYRVLEECTIFLPMKIYFFILFHKYCTGMPGNPFEKEGFKIGNYLLILNFQFAGSLFQLKEYRAVITMFYVRVNI